MKKIIIICFLFSIVSNSQTNVKGITSESRSGTLILTGGGKKGDVVMGEFKKEVGGDSAKIVIIPNGIPQNFLENDSVIAFNSIREEFRNYGFKNVKILYLKDSIQANNDKLIEPLKTADGVYFTPGRPHKFIDAYLNTKAHKELSNLLNRGGTILGASGGATAQGSFLVRGDTKSNQIMMGDHQTGLGFIKNIAIDQHALIRNRHFDLLEVVQAHPDILGIGIDEKTAVIVKQDTLEVIGDSYVLIYDNTFWSRSRNKRKPILKDGNYFYFLKSGDRYNLSERKVIRK